MPHVPTITKPTTNINYQYVTISFHGSYFAVLRYLQALEQHPNWIIVLDDLNYEVSNYPMAAVTLNLHLVKGM